MIRVFKLSKIYRNESAETLALKNVSFEIKKGEFVAIMGPSGSGKSTLMHILGALDKSTSGKYFLDGTDVSKMNADELADIRNQKIGFVFQAFNLLPRYSAVRNVSLPMMYGGIEKEKRHDLAIKYLKMVGLGDRLDYTPSQLSGGQKQRVAIARALAMNPSIILADEPTGNIATKQAAEIMEILQELNDKGNTILIITHEKDIAEYAKRTITIRDGELAGDKKNGTR
ncbi:macrolide ABC transporter ATP-binding protein [Candidatus Woesebacteria bacterium RIFCSPHIGHO2_02_FULL_42_20]|uniref:Macrolide ABC transporter ATP-binding protein n=1 Tax=Candidatus Woesebacteria bacterium RIFCSPHIGHO2_12_FULL_41_24 TaxID=1802510 RepID=A0A1F8AQ72_9BACT|nr:MAG: macrolide ABC transporter ATP-binding protein [Candidatus Woesebacteria bacterium RBG_16_41_13]OGM30728.1 MAG: macrolide ABC transporter ATP-binding protein [Candidatus Woesebacteria bacterium RIFCSPHIGHO2_01_FULL_42_80]OGM35865.1 MAG: macrolide ABC transporter ATP-binding protein [Candidatus Woesebacteria bacterium RIFCSPHIGHO2_02_FULL_42_20]OGM53923.1 MAG: macrolide ABC transporter ATP-binding protein [Candidatus Woesebacteria bacterium RIFCSPHIGHO2_12_FULL_41_24]OGM66115.1 MAG: macro